MSTTLKTYPSGPRAPRLVLVLLLHLLFIWALTSGLARKVVQVVSEPIEARLIEDAPPAAAAPEAPKPALPTPKLPTPTQVQPPELVINSAPAGNANPNAATGAQTGSSATVSAEQVCTRMAKPELPNVGFSGDALFRVVARVQNGRVASADVRRLRGDMNRREQGQLSSAIQSALSGYVCPNATEFQQEFLFNIR